MGALCPPPLTNEPDRPGGSVLPLTLPGAGSFMKNKLIMHTKLHLQETLRCILQASKMIRFTFCSRRRVVPPSRSVVKLRVGQCGCALLVACMVLVPVPVLGLWPGLQAAVHRSCWQLGSQAESDAWSGRKAEASVDRAIGVVCKGPLVTGSMYEAWWGGKGHRALSRRGSIKGVCLSVGLSVW